MKKDIHDTVLSLSIFVNLAECCTIQALEEHFKQNFDSEINNLLMQRFETNCHVLSKPVADNEFILVISKVLSDFSDEVPKLDFIAKTPGVQKIVCLVSVSRVVNTVHY